MHIGCARVSTDGPDQTTDLQRDALIEAGDLFEYRVSGSRADRSALKAALDYVQSGDVLLVWKLDRLGCSLSHLLQIVADIEERGVGFRSLTQSSLDTTK